MRVAPFVVVVLFAAGCISDESAPRESASTNGSPNGSSVPFAVRSSAFESMGEIPRRHTCDDANVSPPLEFTGVPQAAETIALIMEDPDAPGGRVILHWTFWNVAAAETHLDEEVNIPSVGGREGKTYGGPCPPDGEHRYFFYAYAVDTVLELAAGSSVEELRAALKDHTLAETEMYGTYCRPNVEGLPCVDPM